VKILTAVFSKPLSWSFIGITAISAFTGSISSEDRYNIWLAGADARHQQWLEQMVADLRDGQVVSDDSECGCGTGVMLFQEELYEYVKRGELTEGQASNYCPFRLIPEDGIIREHQSLS
jgi:hypothetical protein